MTPGELASAIKAHPFAEVAPELMDAITKIALGKSQPFTPVDTGRLVSSETPGVEPGGMRGFVSTDVDYAVYQKTEFFQLGADASVAEAEALLAKIGAAYFDVIARGS